eukprot:TRINITY_DN25327_c0_g2_i1.p1 TRINITY_DN25327_c0_g2~~TRINITY_DN25327_c0_g2_i1.p1  ORF type:complete len:396 (+),score=37.82 TRINITY_DN25327_c0_g2_i1:199-1386(+)
MARPLIRVSLCIGAFCGYICSSSSNSASDFFVDGHDDYESELIALGAAARNANVKPWATSPHSRLRCHDDRAPARVEVAVGVKTNRFYHSTRAVAVWQSWGHLVGHGLTFVSDGPLDEAKTWSASVVVVENDADDRRFEPYSPPWRRRDNAEDVDPAALPQLTRRVLALLEAMAACWGDRANWFLVADDDTFVRPDRLVAFLRSESADEIRLIGQPMSSDAFALPSHQRAFGPSEHCGGGSGVILSRALLQALTTSSDSEGGGASASRASACVTGPPKTTLAWYWDEVELLGRCVYELFRTNCSMLPLPLVGEGELPLAAQMSTKGDENLVLLQGYVDASLSGNWSLLPIATLHPVEESQMIRLGHFLLPTVDRKHAILEDTAQVRKDGVLLDEL